MNLEEGVRQWVIEALPYDRADSKLVAYLNGLDAHKLLVVYHNWMNRLIRPQPREVRRSKAFEKNPLVRERSDLFARIIEDIVKGNDLKKYLSRGVKSAIEIPGKSYARRSDLDLMLNDWGIHHLHISTELETDGFVKRDEPLLFAIFRPRVAYLIDVMNHGDWNCNHVIEVLASEWPDEGIIHQIRGGQGFEVIGLARNPSEAERAALRSKGVNVLLEIGGKVFMPAGGMSSAGTTIQATRAADKLLLDLRAFEKMFKADPDQLKRVFESQGVAFPENPVFEFAITEHGYGVIETESQTFLNLAA